MGPFPLVIRGGLGSTALVHWEHILWPQDWTHRIEARGGFRSAAFTLYGGRDYLWKWFEQGLARPVVRYDDVGQIIWEGYVFALTLALPGLQYSRTLDNLSNRTYANYSVTDFSGDVPVSGETQITAAAEDSDSQNLYGISESVVNSSAATKTNAEADRDDHHARYRRPLRNARDLPGGDLALAVECRGWSEWYKHRTYTSDTLGVGNASSLVSTVNTDVGQFISATQLDTNSLQVGRYYSSVDREYAWDILNEVTNYGDGTNRWEWGVWEGRTLKYQQVTESVSYVRRYADPYRRIETASDRLAIPPWRLRAGKYIRQPDALPLNLERSAAFELDPTMSYIQAVSWAESQPYDYAIEFDETENLKAVLASSTYWEGPSGKG